MVIIQCQVCEHSMHEIKIPVLERGTFSNQQCTLLEVIRLGDYTDLHTSCTITGQDLHAEQVNTALSHVSVLTPHLGGFLL